MYFFFNDTATTEIYTLSLHDALPIYFDLRRAARGRRDADQLEAAERAVVARDVALALEDVNLDRGLVVHDGRERLRLLQGDGDRKSTRLNSSHANISYAVFCLKKKKY